jgi:hypothetical protein
MIRRRMRYLTPYEEETCEPLTPLQFLFASAKRRERAAGLVEILEFRVDKAWLVPGCDHGVGCCPGSLLLRTPERPFISLSGTVSSSKVYDFRWGSMYKSGRCDGEHVFVERWPNSKGIYSGRFSGAPVEHVYLDEWNARWGRLTRNSCDIVDLAMPNELREETQ